MGEMLQGYITLYHMVWFYNIPGKDPEKHTAEGYMSITLHFQPQPREDMASPSFCYTLWSRVFSWRGNKVWASWMLHLYKNCHLLNNTETNPKSLRFSQTFFYYYLFIFYLVKSLSIFAILCLWAELHLQLCSYSLGLPVIQQRTIFLDVLTHSFIPCFRGWNTRNITDN